MHSLVLHVFGAHPLYLNGFVATPPSMGSRGPSGMGLPSWSSQTSCASSGAIYNGLLECAAWRSEEQILRTIFRRIWCLFALSSGRCAVGVVIPVALPMAASGSAAFARDRGGHALHPAGVRSLPLVGLRGADHADLGSLSVVGAVPRLDARVKDVHSKSAGGDTLPEGSLVDPRLAHFGAASDGFSGHWPQHTRCPPQLQLTTAEPPPGVGHSPGVGQTPPGERPPPGVGQVPPGGGARRQRLALQRLHRDGPGAAHRAHSVRGRSHGLVAFALPAEGRLDVRSWLRPDHRIARDSVRRQRREKRG